jgi:hypothetical protein
MLPPQLAFNQKLYILVRLDGKKGDDGDLAGPGSEDTA